MICSYNDIFLTKTVASITLIAAVFFSHAQLEQDLTRFKSEQKYDSALITLNQLLIQAENDQNDSLKVEYKLQIGTILCILHRCKQGVINFKEAFQLADQINNPYLKANAKMGVGNYFLFESIFDSAEIYYQSSIQYFEQGNYQDQVINVQHNLAYLYYTEGDIERARKEYQSIIETRLQDNDSAKIAETYFNIALTFQNQALTDDALGYLNESRKYTRDQYLIAKIRRREALIHYDRGELKTAAKKFLTYDSLINDHVNRDYASELTALEEQFNTAEVERINLLQQAEIDKSNQRLKLLYVSLAALIIVSILIYILLNYRRKQQRIAAENQIQELLSEQETKATYALLEGQDKERKRIAEELHDNLGSILVTLNMYADALQHRGADEIPAIAGKIAEAAQMANTETRKISHSLDTGMLKHFGLETAVLQLSEAVSTARDILFKPVIQTEKVSSELAIEIYRIIQELVNNSLKHAHCSKIQLELTQVDDSLSVIYEDDGIGFQKDQSSKGMGLNNIENRVQRMDGELTIDSAPGKGSTFIVEIPNIWNK